MAKILNGNEQQLPPLTPGYARCLGSSVGGNIAVPDYIANAANHNATTTGSMTASNLRAMPFVAPARGGTLSRIACEVTTLNADDNLTLGLYRNLADPRSIYPGARLQTSGNISTGSAAIKSYTISQVLEPGVVYWVVLNTSDAVTMRALPVAGVSHFLGMELAATTALNMGIIVASTYGSAPMPDPFPGGGTFITATPVPLLTYQFSA